MTDTAPPPAPAPAPVPGQPSAPKKAPNVVGLVALALAVVTLLLAVIPPTSFIAWIPAVAAIVVAIIALTRKNQTKGMAIAAIIVAPIAWIIAIVVALSATVMAVDTAIKDSGSGVTTTEESAATDGADAPASEQPATVGIGTPVTSGSKMTYTVAGMTCGLDKAGNEYYPEVASGQFCEVKTTIANGGSETFDMYTSNVKAFIDGSEYEPNAVASTFGQDSFGTSINPGLSIETVLYFDVPKDKTLQTIEFSEAFTFDDAVAISLQ
jgi:hypothetical protein